MKKGDIYEVLISEHDINGNGITRINNFVIFVKNGLKDELIKIKITKVNKRYAEAKIIEIIKKSPLRKEVNCPYYLKYRCFIYCNKWEWIRDSILFNAEFKT